MIAIIDYGMGNLGSIHNMLAKLGAESVITSSPKAISEADKIILSGVGSFDNAVNSLKGRGLIEVLSEQTLNKKKPLLGICLGMQLLSKDSEEGSLPGLGWIDAHTVRFNFDPASSRLKVPHMGWNRIEIKSKSLLLDGLPMDARFYFVHSYHVVCRDEGDVRATTDYGINFTSVIQKGNIYGTQFHPEKSHMFGMALLRNFVEKM